MLQAAQAFEFAWDLQAQPLQAPLTCRWELRCPAVPGSAAQVAFRHFDTAIEVRLTVSDPATRPVGNLAGRLRDGAGTFVSEGSSLFLPRTGRRPEAPKDLLGLCGWGDNRGGNKCAYGDNQGGKQVCLWR